MDKCLSCEKEIKNKLKGDQAHMDEQSAVK